MPYEIDKYGHWYLTGPPCSEILPRLVPIESGAGVGHFEPKATDLVKITVNVSVSGGFQMSEEEVFNARSRAWNETFG